MNLVQSAAVLGGLGIALTGAPVLAQVTSTWAQWYSASGSGAIGTQTAAIDWDGITVTDKTFTLVDYGATVSIQGTPENAATFDADNDWVEADTALQVGITAIPATNRHQVNMNPSSLAPFDFTGFLANETTAIQYIVNIDASVFPAEPGDEVFSFAFLGLQVIDSGNIRVSKRIQGLTPVSATGGVNPWSLNTNFDLGAIFDETITTTDQTNQSPFCGTCTTWLITDYVTTLTGAGLDTSLSQIGNTVQQETYVPAPGALVLLATGLIGIGAARRMKKAA